MVGSVGPMLKASAGVAVLGLLLERPSYGYELDQRFRRAFSEGPAAWELSQQAIYNHLRRLQRRGLITAEETGISREISAQRSTRQLYRASPEGARTMREWLASPMSPRPSREEVLIRLHFGETDDQEVRQVLSRHAEACLLELQRIGAMPAATRRDLLVKEEMRLTVQARLSWIEFARALVRGPDDSPIRQADDP